jgi:hypothetical protein
MKLAVLVLITLSLAVLVLITLRRRRAARAPAHPGRLRSAPARCPRCEARLKLGPFRPGRLIGACPGRRCGEVVVFHSIEGRLDVVGRSHR